MNKPKILEQNIVKCKIVPKFEKKFMFVEYILTNFMLFLRGNKKKCDHLFGNAFTFCTHIRLQCILNAQKTLTFT